MGWPGVVGVQSDFSAERVNLMNDWVWSIF